MTEERMALIELIEKGADADLVREMLAFAADRLMAPEAEGRTGAPAGGRAAPGGPTTVTVTGSAPGARAPGGSTSRSRGCARAPASPPSLSRAGPPRRP